MLTSTAEPPPPVSCMMLTGGILAFLGGTSLERRNDCTLIFIEHLWCTVQ